MFDLKKKARRMNGPLQRWTLMFYV